MAESRSLSGIGCIEVCAGGHCSGNCDNNHETGGGTSRENHSNGTNGGGRNGTGENQMDEIRDRVLNPRQIPETNTEPVKSAADEIIKKAGETRNQETTKSTLDAYKNAVLIALGIALLPEEIVAGASYVLTALAIGPVSEGMIGEVLANEAFIQAATKAGAILGAGKYLNIFGVFKSNNIAAKVVAEHPCQGMTVEQVVQKALNLGVDTPRDSLILWSGLGIDDAGVIISKEFAERNGGVTLEMTPGRSWLNDVNLYDKMAGFTKDEINKIWESVSLELVRKASGQVRSVVGQVKADSVYTQELKELLDNPNVTGVDELQVKPRVIFKNSR